METASRSGRWEGSCVSWEEKFPKQLALCLLGPRGGLPGSLCGVGAADPCDAAPRGHPGVPDRAGVWCVGKGRRVPGRQCPPVGLHDPGASALPCPKPRRRSRPPVRCSRTAAAAWAPRSESSWCFPSMPTCPLTCRPASSSPRRPGPARSVGETTPRPQFPWRVVNKRWVPAPDEAEEWPGPHWGLERG